MPDVKPRASTLLWTMVAVALAVTFAAAAGIPVRATHGAQTSGDEPHYLITALSLGEDAGLDIADERVARLYRPFHETPLPTQAQRRPDGTMVAPHDPLLPALLAVPMAVGGWIAAKSTLAVLTGLLAAVLVWTAVRRFGVPLPVAAVTTGLLVASAPLAVYGNQVYPELPAALVVAVAIAALTRPAPRGRETVLLGLAVTALPWLSVKYVPVAAGLAVIALARLRRGHTTRAAAWLAGGLAAAGLFYLVAHLVWYGGTTVYAAGDFFADHGGQLSVVGTAPNFLGRSTRLLGLLVGSDFGLAAWQPAWLLAVPAVAALVRHRPAGWAALVGPLAVGWTTATFVAATMQGWWFPGRQVVVVLPAAAIALAWWTGRGSRRLIAVVLAGALGVVGYGFLVAEGAARKLTWVVDVFATGYPWYRGWRLMLPDYLDITAGTWVRHGLWLIVVAFLAVWGARSNVRATPPVRVIAPGTSPTDAKGLARDVTRLSCRPWAGDAGSTTPFGAPSDSRSDESGRGGRRPRRRANPHLNPRPRSRRGSSTRRSTGCCPARSSSSAPCGRAPRCCGSSWVATHSFMPHTSCMCGGSRYGSRRSWPNGRWRSSTWTAPSSNTSCGTGCCTVSW